MNTYMRNARMTVKGRNPVHHDSLSLRGNTIRCYILPDSINLDTLLVDDGPKQKVNPAAAGRSAVRAPRGGGGGRGGGEGGGRGRGGGRR